jgi:CubicO group peptidase (beta-lactamase class C family)
MKKAATGLLGFLPFLLFAQSTLPKEKPLITSSQFKSIQDSIESKITTGAIPSLSVAVSKGGKVIWLQSFGWADKEMKIKATPSTPYAIASLSKSITSTALMLLVEKGLVSLNDPVDKYLGSSKLTYFQGNASRLTINHLINMAGGIPHQWQYFYRDDTKQPETIKNQIKHYGIVVFPPGDVFNYSNFSPAIIELIINNVTGKTLEEFVEASLFTPLGMKYASVNRNSPVTSIAKGYDNAGQLLVESEFYPKGGAGYYAAVEDLIKYGMFHLKDKSNDHLAILKDENIDKLHTPVLYTHNNKFYADGWGVLKFQDGKTSLLSNGAIDGAASSLLLLPDCDIAVACLTNASVGNDFTDQMTFNIANSLVPGYLDELQEFFKTNEAAFADKPFRANDSLLGTWKGVIVTYIDSIPIQLVIDSNNKIVVHIANQFETILNNVVVSNGLIQGQCYGNIEVPETEGIPHYLELVLKPGAHEMYGSISAQSFHTKRPYFLLPFYLWLKKNGPQ